MLWDGIRIVISLLFASRICEAGVVHMVKLDPRSSILTQDAPAALSSSGRQSYCGATGESFTKISPFFEQCPANLAHSPGDDGDGHIGILASGAMEAVKPAKIGRTTYCHPGRFDKRPLQPFVAALEQWALLNFSTAGVGLRDYSRVSA